MLSEGLEVPGEKDELTHRPADPGRIGVGHQRPAVPLPVTEPVADVVAQLVVAGGKGQPPPWGGGGGGGVGPTPPPPPPPPPAAPPTPQPPARIKKIRQEKQLHA